MTRASNGQHLLLVIGAGPAGLAAAAAAAERGLHVLLVDEAAEPGGQYLSETAHGNGFQTKTERAGIALIARLRELGQSGRVDARWRTTAWSLGPDLCVMLRCGDGGSSEVERVQADAIVLSTGARETLTPFPGWTLSGVMTVGAGQLLAKRYGVLPPSRRATGGYPPRVLFAGSGPLLLPAAARLAELGAQVAGVLDTARLNASWIERRQALRHPGEWALALAERRGEAWHYLMILRKHRVPYLFGRAILAALGSDDGRLDAVEVARLDRTGAPIAGSRETWPVDALCTGSGLVPNIDLAQLAGARLVYAAALGGWAVAVDEVTGVRTSVPGLFAAGETAGVCGASGALLSGRMAGMAAAAFAGGLSQSALEAEMAQTARARRRQARFGEMVNLLFAAPEALFRGIPDETPVCRCEEVTAGQVRAAVRAGVRSLDALKPALRVGQGLCQGRTCGPILARILAAETGQAVEAAGLFQARPPVRPVPLSAIAALAAPGTHAERAARERLHEVSRS